MEDTKRLFHELFQKVRFLTKEMNEHLQVHGLHSSQWAILFCLKENGPMKQTEIWRYLNVEAPTVTRTLTRLEEGEWITRKQGTDKRERIVMLTDKAQEAIPDIEQTIEQFEQKMTARLSDAEQDTLLSLLQKLGISS